MSPDAPYKRRQEHARLCRNRAWWLYQLSAHDGQHAMRVETGYVPFVPPYLR